MNDHPYLRRAAARLLELALNASPVLVLMGARQTGKSTLVRSEAFLREHLYLTLDDLDVRDRAARTPHDLVRAAPRMILDEVQREPDLILAIKQAVDERGGRKPGRFIITGSANLLLMQRISETLAGRATYITLWPFTRHEKLGHGRTGIWSDFFTCPAEEWRDLVAGSEAPAADWRHEARVGGYPTPALTLDNDALRTVWFDGYVRTYLERDLQDLSAIDNLLDFRRVMRAAALRIGHLLNQAELGRDTGIPRPTVHRYINLLETSFQSVRVEAYSVNRTRRLIKSPKLYWSDSALALHVSGEEDPRGAHLENVILGDLLAWRDAQIPRPEILYWRTTAGLEVDFVIEHRGKLLPIEIKSTARPATSDVRGLVAFREEYRRKCAGALLLHCGDTVQWLANGVLAVPWHHVC